MSRDSSCYAYEASIVCAYDPMPRDHSVSSIFLAGPTPRDPKVSSWRPDAIAMLRHLGYLGYIFVPEPRDGAYAIDRIDQWRWETAALEIATAILFWIPRDMVTLPGLTTNDEWGHWKTSGKCVFGAPETAPSVSYQRWWAERLEIPSSTTLEQVSRDAISIASELIACYHE